MGKINFYEYLDKLDRDYESQINNLMKHNSKVTISSLLYMDDISDRYFFNINTVSNVYNTASDKDKESLSKIIYYLLMKKYNKLTTNSHIKTSIYSDDDNIYNVSTYLFDENPLLSFELKCSDKKVELIFYEDLMETEKTLSIRSQIAHLHEQLYMNYKATRNIQIENMYFGGGANYFKDISDCNYELDKEYKETNIYSSKETDGFATRKSLIEIYFNTLECLVDFYNIDRTSIKEGDKITLKEYPFMDISVIFTNKRDIKQITDSPKTLIKK